MMKLSLSWILVHSFPLWWFSSGEQQPQHSHRSSGTTDVFHVPSSFHHETFIEYDTRQDDDNDRLWSDATTLLSCVSSLSNCTNTTSMSRCLYPPIYHPVAVNATAALSSNVSDWSLDPTKEAIATSADTTCRVYLAPSTIPGAGLGIFAGQDFHQGDEVTPGDVVVPIRDMAWYHKEGQMDTYLWDDYTWRGETFPSMTEPHHDVNGASFGIGAIPNCLFSLVNVRDSHDTKRDYCDLPRSTSPGIGAFTPWYDRRSYATQDIVAGAEIFVDYGYNYFEGPRKDTFGLIPFLEDFDTADILLEQFANITDKLLHSTSWKQCTVDAQIAREEPRRLDAIEESGDFNSFKVAVFDLARSVIGTWPTRTLAALPDHPHAINELLNNGGTKMKDYERSIRDVSFLHEHGSCMDYLEVKPSTIPVAGRGAFATRDLPIGSVVAPVPLIHIPHRKAMDIYPGSGMNAEGLDDETQNLPLHQQLLINYCFGHIETTLLLCPYGVVSSVVNHAPTTATCDHGDRSTMVNITANVKIVWSEKTLTHPEWREQPIETWAYTNQAGLGFEYVALRDITAGEEIFVDYGHDWQVAWDKHVANWNPRERLIDVLNQDIDSIVPTQDEWKWSMGDPIDNHEAVNLWCYNIYREMQGLDPYADDAYPCKIVLRQDTGQSGVVYTAEVVMRKQREDSDDEICEECFDEVLWMLPRDALAYGGVYELFDTRDYIRPDTFRHPLGIPDDLMPNIWKNAPKQTDTKVTTEQPTQSKSSAPIL